LEKRTDFHFISYPFQQLPHCDGYIMLVMEGAEALSFKDRDSGIIVLDSTWRYLPKMIKAVENRAFCEKRVLPEGFATAYPRRQEDCEDPARGLASIEAIYIAYFLLGRPAEELLEGYFWKKPFLERNRLTFSRFKP
jgi:pre-rRNA-processing protein TSR3